MDKLEFIQSYIKRCDEAIASANTESADELQDEIIGIFEPEISDIKNMLESYTSWKDHADFIKDIKLIKQKLINHAINFQNEQRKLEYDLEMARLKQPQISAHAEANPTQNATATSNVTITINQAIKQLNKISDDSLSPNDKDILKEYLFSLEGIKAAKDKNKFWDKAKEVLKFLADKGADAAITTLPLIIAGFQSLN